MWQIAFRNLTYTRLSSRVSGKCGVKRSARADDLVAVERNIMGSTDIVAFILKLVNVDAPESQDREADAKCDDLLDEDELIRKAEALNGTPPFAHTPFYPGVSGICQAVGRGIL